MLDVFYIINKPLIANFCNYIENIQLKTTQLQ